MMKAKEFFSGVGSKDTVFPNQNNSEEKDHHATEPGRSKP
jgi:hypothetical protein